MAIRSDSKASESVTVRIPVEWMDEARKRGLGGNTEIVHAAMRLLLGLPDQRSSSDALQSQIDEIRTLLGDVLQSRLAALDTRLTALERNALQSRFVAPAKMPSDVKQEIGDREQPAIEEVIGEVIDASEAYRIACDRGFTAQKQTIYDWGKSALKGGAGAEKLAAFGLEAVSKNMFRDLGII